MHCDSDRFRADPVHVWLVSEGQRQLQISRQPTMAHRSIARWMRDRRGVRLITQNIDGLHERAALAVGDPAAAKRMLRLHGTLHRGRCTGCRQGVPLPAVIDTRSAAHLPHCRSCGGLIRPAVVWFGDPLSSWVLRQAQAAVELADVGLVIGTALDVEPAARLPWSAQLYGVHLIEVNPQPVIAATDTVTSVVAPADMALPLMLDGLASPPGLT